MRRLVLALALAIAATGPVVAAAGDVTVFAAASLKDALDGINAEWQKETGKHAAISYAASSALAKQIESGGAGRHLHLRRSRLDGLSRQAGN